MAANPLPCRSDWAEHAREILRQYNKCQYTQHRFQGPHYVTYDRGEFYLKPFSHHGYSFRCDPEFVSWQDEPLWCFNVL